MKGRVALLVMEDLSGFECYDHLLIKPMAAIGWQAEMVPWTADVDWGHYDAIVIRAPWDYQQKPEVFLQTLDVMEASGTPVFNPVDVVRWNLCKTYLKDLNEKGVPILPTRWEERLTRETVLRACEMFDGGKVVLKPWVSANADHTYVVCSDSLDDQWPSIEASFASRRAMLQPFVDDICHEGEYSLFYFAGEYSHAILKTPAEGDFRVQEEHGGRIRSVTPPTPLPELSEHLLSTIQPLLYVRLDWVRWQNGWALMEAELIEPSLYFNMDEASPARFARAFDRWMKGYQS